MIYIYDVKFRMNIQRSLEKKNNSSFLKTYLIQISENAIQLKKIKRVNISSMLKAS